MTRFVLFVGWFLLCIGIMGCKKDSDGIDGGDPGRCQGAGIVIEAMVDADTIIIKASGGQAPYTYSVDGQYFSYLDKFVNLSEKEYRVYVQDANRCYATTKATVEYKATFYDERSASTYRVVKKGKQVWMADNLRYKLEGNTFCYNDLAENCERMGSLYLRETTRDVCPSGWRLPSVSDYLELIDTLAGRGDVYGQLVEEGSGGFNLRLTGYKQAASYLDEGQAALLWTSDIVVSGSDTTYSALKVTSDGLYHIEHGGDKESAFSVRCLRD